MSNFIRKFRSLFIFFIFIGIINVTKTQEFSYKDEETEEEQALELDVLADEIKDIFHQNSYGMMNIENNYIEAMLSETFRYKDIDKNMRLSVRVKDAFIKYNSDKWLEKFKDVNTEWINECICNFIFYGIIIDAIPNTIQMFGKLIYIIFFFTFLNNISAPSNNIFFFANLFQIFRIRRGENGT